MVLLKFVYLVAIPTEAFFHSMKKVREKQSGNEEREEGIKEKKNCSIRNK